MTASSLSGLSGLASGIDTAAIVDQLMAIERKSTQKITNKQSRVTAEGTALKGIATKLAALKTAADALRKDSAVFKPTQTVDSSDPTRVSVAMRSGAGIGGHSIQVDRLAASAQQGYTIGDMTAGGAFSVNGVDFTFAAGVTPAAMADAINARADSPVFAAIVKSGTDQRLVLSARTTGESSRFTVPPGGVLTADPAYESPAGSLNALYRMDGAAVAAQYETNVLDDAIPGLRLTLKGVTTSPASINVGAADINRSDVKSKIKAVVDAYNAIVDTTRTAINEKPVANPATTTDLNKGQLFGDTGMNAMLSRLRTDLRATIGGLSGVDDLSDLGIGVPGSSGGVSTADAKAGRFTIDDAKLTQALSDDWTKVSKFMDAFAGKVTTMVENQTGKTTSLIDQRLAGETRTSKLLSDQLTTLNARLDAHQARLKAQFSAMETAMSNSQTQQAWLTGQLNALGR